MANSSTGGYLLGSGPDYDEAFEDFLHDVLAGVSGLRGDLVRPAWQPEPPNLPARDANWLAFSVLSLDPDTYAAVTHHDPIDGVGDDLSRHETVEVLLSAYGPKASGVLAGVRDGFQIEQNREALLASGVGFQATGAMIAAPVLVKDRFTRRFDMRWTFRREIRRTYPVLSLVSASVTIDNELHETDVLVSAI